MERNENVFAHRGGLILALGILSWLFCPLLALFLGWFFCPLLAVLAWGMGAGDLEKMRQGTMDNAGEGLTKAGTKLGKWLVVVFVLSIVVMFVLSAIVR
jgi:hypothetical protein